MEQPVFGLLFEWFQDRILFLLVYYKLTRLHISFMYQGKFIGRKKAYEYGMKLSITGALEPLPARLYHHRLPPDKRALCHSISNLDKLLTSLQPAEGLVALQLQTYGCSCYKRLFFKPCQSNNESLCITYSTPYLSD